MGFQFIIRSYASHGPIDLLCANDSGDLWAVQVKSAWHGSYLSTKELERLVEWSRKFNAKPVFAFKKKGRWTFKHLTSTESIRSAANEASATKNEGVNLEAELLQEMFEERLSEI
jgi:Holliday junction resolvase